MSDRLTAGILRQNDSACSMTVQGLSAVRDGIACGTSGRRIPDATFNKQQVASGNDCLVVASTGAIVFVTGGALNLFSICLKDQGCVSHSDRPAEGRQVVVGDMARHLVRILLHQEANAIPPENRSLGCSGQRHCDPETPHHVEPF
jgi:hypothetical protein